MIPSKREIKKNNNNNVAKHAQNRFCCATRPRLDRHFPLGHSPSHFGHGAHSPLPRRTASVVAHYATRMLHAYTVPSLFHFRCCTVREGKTSAVPKEGREKCSRGDVSRGKYPTLQDCSIGMDFTAIFATSLVCWAGFGDNRELCRNGRTDRDAVWGVGQTLRGPRSHLLDGSAHWCHLANTTKQSVCGGDGVLRQITLATSLLWRSCSTCSTRWHCSTSRCCSSMLSRSPGNRSRS